MRRDARELLPPPVRISAIACLVTVITLPIAFMLLLSITPDPEIGAGRLIPSHWAFDNYAKMWSTVNLGRGLPLAGQEERLDLLAVLRERVRRELEVSFTFPG